MKVAYFDCSSGISGDMVLGACLDAGVQQEAFVAELRKLDLPGWTLSARKVRKQHIAATKVDIEYVEQAHHRHYADIVALIDRSGLSIPVKERAKAVFAKLAQAEARAHGEPTDHIHFHEVGAIDSILDIVGFAVCMELLGVERIYASSLPISRGVIHCEHGIMPVPAPGTLNCLEGLKVYGSDVVGELVTPTGAAIIAASAQQAFPAMTLKRVGVGAGAKDFPHPNILRLLLGSETGQDPIVDTHVHSHP